MRIGSSRGASDAFYLITIAFLIVIIGVFAILYFNATHDVGEGAHIVAVVTGTDHPLPKTLDPKFHDSDGNLFAGPPADPRDFVDPDPLVFSFVADHPEDYRVVWKDFTDYLAKVTGKRVEYAMDQTTSDQIRDFADGKIHVTGFNTGSVPMAVNIAGFVPAFGMGTRAAGGYLHMEIIVPADSTIQTPADLRGHSITFVDVNSNSGCKAALVILKTKFNLLPEQDYTIRYSLGQERSIEGIADKTYEAAAVASDLLEREVSAGKIKKEQYRTIYSSEDFPAVALGYAYNLKPELAAKVREAFNTFKFPGSSLEARFAASKQDSFRPIDYKNEFTLVRFIDDQIGRPYHLPPAAAPETQPAAATMNASK
ncbi:MAG TPA: phosphate/phosphite/phosphonate ABC transporter substrate-binding protein [Phycisphaerae bacterium]|nr:phosphate/phosphite/phosphonate ABC transporter substrate-binding protein [Phycisphaerae bacterium]